MTDHPVIEAFDVMVQVVATEADELRLMALAEASPLEMQAQLASMSCLVQATHHLALAHPTLIGMTVEEFRDPIRESLNGQRLTALLDRHQASPMSVRAIVAALARTIR